MSELKSCRACQGFIPNKASRCPHCSARVALVQSDLFVRLAKKALAISSGGAMAMTLMACYGAPPGQDSDDADGDGYYGGFCADVEDGEPDCDDTNADIHPGADDPLGDDIDQNCDGADGIAPAVEEDAGTTPADAGSAPSDAGT